ncbi:hypothetical protein GCM10027436_16700 [Actinophytocola sediminis]
MSRLTRIQVLALAAAVPPVLGYAVIAGLLALVTAAARFAHLSATGVLGAALPSWLAAYQVPVAIGGVDFGALPLLPTLLVMVLACGAAGAAITRLGPVTPLAGVRVVAAITVAHGVCGLTVALLPPGRLVELDPLAAFYYPALLAAIAATVGVLRRGGLTGVLVARLDEVAVRGLAAGAVALALLLTAGAAVAGFGLLTSITTARDLFAASASGAGDVVGMVLLCLGYLPNAVIAGTAFLAGPGFAIGGLEVSPLTFTGGPVPGVPLLAALPEEQAVWWPVLALLPVAVGILVGRRLRYVAEQPVVRLRAVAVAVGVVAVAIVLLAGSAGGRLGNGAFDPVSMRAPAVSVALVLAVGVPAALVVWFRKPPAMDGVEDEVADEVDSEDDGGVDGGVAVAEPAKAGDPTGGPAG